MYGGFKLFYWPFQGGASFVDPFCSQPLRRKAEGVSFCLSVFPSFRLSILPSALPSPIRSRYLVGATPPTALYRFFRSIHWCAGHGLEICMWFGYNPQIIFCHFFRKLNLAIFPALYLAKWMDRVYLVGATPPTVLYLFIGNFTGVFLLFMCRVCQAVLSVHCSLVSPVEKGLTSWLSAEKGLTSWLFAEKVLTSWLSCMWRFLVFATFPCSGLGQVWNLIVSISDLCLFPNFSYPIQCTITAKQSNQINILWRNKENAGLSQT